MPLLSVADLETRYRTPAGELRALDGVSLEVAAGETVGVVGESGCGKSTLARTVARLVDASAGRIAFDGEDVTTLPTRRLGRFRRRLQMVFQDPLASLNPRQTIRHILLAPLDVHAVGTRSERQARVADVLADVGLPTDALDRYPHEFSGGQRQRIGIARALVLGPELVICDEPVSALDLSVQAQVLNLLARIKAERGLAYLFISHDLAIVRWFTDRVLVMYLGRIVESAPTAALWRAPLHPYTRALMAAAPDPARRRHAVPLAGDLPGAEAIPSGCRFHPRCPLAVDRCRTDDPALAPRADGHQVACHLA